MMMTFGIASVAIIVLAALTKVGTYRIAPLLLIPILLAPLLLRRWIALHPFHYILFAAAVLLHMLGAREMYQRSIAGVSFDVYVHGYFGGVGTLLFRRALAQRLHLGPLTAAAFALMFVMGAGAIHEIGEYASYLALGEERGMLKPSTSYFFDPQRDLLSNLCGAIVALACCAMYSRTRRRSCASDC